MARGVVVRWRPAARKRVDASIVEQLRKTAESGNSVKIPLGGEPAYAVRARYRTHLLLKHSLALRSKREGEVLIAWVEK